MGIARHLILKRWRVESRWTPLEEDNNVPAPEPPPADWTTVNKVAYAVQSLPPLQREVVLLVEYEGMSLQEAAATVDAELGTVKARLHRARENLRRMLEPLRSTP